MQKLMKIVGYILAIIGFACVLKHIMHCKERYSLCGWHKTKEEEKPAGSTVSHKTKEEEKPAGSTVSHKIKVEDEEKRQGTRYGSNPIRY